MLINLFGDCFVCSSLENILTGISRSIGNLDYWVLVYLTRCLWIYSTYEPPRLWNTSFIFIVAGIWLLYKAMSSNNMDVEPPASLHTPLYVPLKTMTGPGPSNIHPRVLKACTLPMLGVSFLHPETTLVYTKCYCNKMKLIRLYLTNSVIF